MYLPLPVVSRVQGPPLKKSQEKAWAEDNDTRGQDDATETGRRATPQTIVDIVRNRTLKYVSRMFSL